MGSLCISMALILRCQPIPNLQSQILIVPTALEVIFSTLLIFSVKRPGWRHLLITAEGWIYFALALLELLSRTVPAARNDLTIFKSLDILSGAASFLPVIFYIMFIYLFSSTEFIEMLPQRLQRLSQLALLLFIPAIVGLSEVSSFIGISYRDILSRGIPVPAVVFISNRDEVLWTFFTSLTLALLTAYQAIVFIFAFSRLIKAFIKQRRIDTSASDQAHLFRGIGWICGALKLGAIETILGFAQGGFNIALTRRIIRFLARAFLCIGLAKGMDSTEDFDRVRQEIERERNRENRKSHLRQLISNPRLSTFHQLTPTATAFHATRRVPPGFAVPSRSVLSMEQLTNMKRDQQQRVTVLFHGGTPALHVRFSALDFSSPLATRSPEPRAQYEMASYQNNNFRTSLPDPSQALFSDTGRYLRYHVKSKSDSHSSTRNVRGPKAGSPTTAADTRKIQVENRSERPSWKSSNLDGIRPLLASSAGNGVKRSVSLTKRKPVPLILSAVKPSILVFGENSTNAKIVPSSPTLAVTIPTRDDSIQPDLTSDPDPLGHESGTGVTPTMARSVNGLAPDPSHSFWSPDQAPKLNESDTGAVYSIWRGATPANRILVYSCLLSQ